MTPAPHHRPQDHGQRRTPKHTIRGDVGKPSGQITVLHPCIIRGLILRLAIHERRLRAVLSFKPRGGVFGSHCS